MIVKPIILRKERIHMTVARILYGKYTEYYLPTKDTQTIYQYLAFEKGTIGVGYTMSEAINNCLNALTK